MNWCPMADRDLAARSAESGHEVSDISPLRVALTGLVLAAVIVMTLLVAYGLFYFFHGSENRARPAPSPLSYAPEPVPEPRLEVAPGEELKALRADEDAALKTYGWVDQEKGVVRIPIDRAIDILAERGLPTRRTKSAPAAENQRPQKGERKR